jgi:hypothetical protein
VKRHAELVTSPKYECTSSGGRFASASSILAGKMRVAELSKVAPRVP